ncbi:MAG: Na+/H+ antiporter NhaC [Gemmatimonadetes bacterium]|nr:Na+/H+ antiporter NhaC [Gemmatimonadota bacterium]NIO31839.1 Na+/H+ antiporter NhaC [Gemmatimonadota bacterium]
MNNERRQPTALEAFLPFIFMALLLGVGYGVYRLRIEVLLIAAAAVAGLVAVRLGYTWAELQSGIIEGIAKALPAALILVCVGALISTWIAAGTIPLLLRLGLHTISPRFFLVTACVLCSFVSLFTGTSWGTVGTIGIALMGVAAGLGVPLGAAAGAIVAGAYFGDKLSPFSDTTNLAPVAAQSNLFDHIRHMLWTTAPAWTLGLLVYLVVGLQAEPAASPERVAAILDTLGNAFVMSPWVLLPLPVVLYFAVRKRPTIPGILLASALAGVIAIIFQGESINDVAEAAVTGYVADTGDPAVDGLLSRGGMGPMMEVTLIVFAAFSFAGIANRAGLLDVALGHLMRLTRTTGQLIAATVGSTIFTALITGSSYLTILLPGELFAPAYRKRNLAAKNLSRTLEDSGTVVVPLIPWSAAGVFMAATLDVPTLSYLPWAVMNYTGFLFAILYGFSGIGIAPRVREDETLAGS